MSQEYIPVNEPLLNGNEKAYLNDCIESGWISSEGPFVDRFERNFAVKVGRKYGISVTNGTAALDIAITALNVREGDEIIMPSFTIISCVLQIVRLGAIPVFVDCDESTWNMDVTQVEEKISPKTRAIMAVHIYGMPVDMNPIMELCEKHQLLLIEDAAEAIGQTYYGKACGSFGHISTVSFYPNKHVTTGEGGMILTDDEEISNRCRSLRNLCFIPENRFVHEELGWNVRFTNIQAALGLAQLERLDESVEKKRWIGRSYNERLKEYPELILPVESCNFAENIYWVYPVVLRDTGSHNAKKVIEKMHGLGVGCRPFFYPLNEQPALLKRGIGGKGLCPRARHAYEMGFYIPSGIALDEEKIDRVSSTLTKVVREAK